MYTDHLDIWTLPHSLSSDPTSEDPSKYLGYIVLKNFCEISKESSRKSVMSIHMQAKSDDSKKILSLLTNNL